MKQLGSASRGLSFACVGGVAAFSAWASDGEASSREVATLPAVQAVGTAITGAPGHRIDVSLDPATLPSASTTIDADDVKHTNVGRDISNVFRRVPGVLANNIDQGDTGNGFRMRGFATQGTHGADVAVYIDGVPQNIPSSEAGAGHGPAFLEWLTPDMIGRMVVIKGPVSALFGDQNRAGAVDIETLSPKDATSLGQLSFESYNGRRATAMLAANLGELSSVFVADAYRADSYRDVARTERDNLMWKLAGRFGNGIYSMRMNYYRAEFTAAGYLRYDRLQAGLVSPKATEEGALPGFGSGERTMIVLNRRPADGEQGVTGTLYGERFIRERGGIAGGTAHNVGSDDRDIFGGRVLQNFVHGETASGAIGVEFRKDTGEGIRQRYVNYQPTTQYLTNLDMDLLTYGVFSQVQYRPLHDIKLLGGLRWDWFDYDIENRKLPAASATYRDSVATPRIGLAWTPTSRLEIYSNIAEGFRSPAAQQISPGGSLGPLGAPGGVTNTGIAPSKVRSYDLGFTTQPADDWTFGAVAYRTLNEDEIVMVSPDNWQSVGSTTREGFDLEARWQTRRDLSVYASYTGILEARIDNAAPGTADKLSVPRHQWKIGLQHRMPAGEGTLTTNVDVGQISGIPYYSGAPLAESEMPIYTRYDFRVGYERGPWQFAGFLVLQPREYASEAAYSTAAGLWVAPQPTASGGVSVGYRF